jgi:dUTP pyrophosphatase
MTDTIETLKAKLAEAEANVERWCARNRLLEHRRSRAEDMLAGREDRPQLRIKRLSPTATLPKYQSAGAAGIDLHVDCRGLEDLSSFSQHRIVRIPTGLALEIPPGYVGLIRPRSSAAERGINVVSATIDSDYRGEVQIQVQAPVTVKHGDRIAQLVIVAAPQFWIVEADELSETERGERGFGSTNVQREGQA